MSNIEWTGESLNPIVGCSIKSPGCKKCYAMPMAARLAAMGMAQYQGLTEPSKTGPIWTGKLAFHPAALDRALKRKKAQTYFVNSMGDLFHEDIPFAWVDRVMACILLTPQHTYQILTKRSDRQREYMEQARLDEINSHAGLLMDWEDMPDDLAWPPANAWMGVSVEDQKRADERIDQLRHTIAAVRFVSFEPLLELVETNLKGIDWAIVGGESGKGASHFDADWARSLLVDCRYSGTAFFMKQMGGAVKSKLPPIPDDLMIREFPRVGEPA